MKATKIKSVSSQLRRTSTKVSFVAKDLSSSGVPTPKDFDSFIPWLCLQLQAARIVTVQRLNKEEYRSCHKKRLSTNSTRSKFKEHEMEPHKTGNKDKKFSSDSVDSISSDTRNAIPLTTYYNTKGYLVEVAFINCPCNINRKVIRAINLSLPFHPLFYKLTIKGGGLTQTVLNEISKLLPYSNLTDVCLDDSDVAEGNYHVLLERESILQNLSLRRCKVNDEMCKNLAYTLEYEKPGSKCLLSLDLTSNRITDLGAEALGRMLRKNRNLLHLSLADNNITDIGAFHILKNLISFPLNDNDLFELRVRYLKYCRNKINVYKQCENAIIDCLSAGGDEENRAQKKRLTEFSTHEGKIENRGRIRRLTQMPKSPDKSQPLHKRRLTETSKPKTSSKLKKCVSSFLNDIIDQAEKMTREIVGDFIDIFDDLNVMNECGQTYALGNLKLCSLNLAYNNLSYHAVRKVYDVLKYQNGLCKPTQSKGLLRVVLDGNNIPKTCEELEAIESYLDLAITENISITEFSHSASNIKSLKKLPKKI